MWERRYEIIQPLRGANRYRIYTDEDVALLRYLKSEMDNGASIGDLAVLGREELLLRMRDSKLNESMDESPLERLLDELVVALTAFDSRTFERKLNGAVAVIPFEDALHGILIPLQRRVGELWHSGEVGIEIEHFVTRLVQQKIFTAMNQFRNPRESLKVVVGCPPGENHDIGAQSIAYLCKMKGFSVYYLGADVPVDSFSSMCSRAEADLTLLSFIMDMPKSHLISVAEELSEKILPVCPIWAGGGGAEKVKDLLKDKGIVYIDDMGTLERKLAQLSKDMYSIKG